MPQGGGGGQQLQVQERVPGGYTGRDSISLVTGSYVGAMVVVLSAGGKATVASELAVVVLEPLRVGGVAAVDPRLCPAAAASVRGRGRFFPCCVHCLQLCSWADLHN